MIKMSFDENKITILGGLLTHVCTDKLVINGLGNGIGPKTVLIFKMIAIEYCITVPYIM